MSKGKRRERQAAELYERAGYETYRPQESKWGETDIFGLFDILTVGNQEVRLSQVKSNRAEGIMGWVADARTFADAVSAVRVDFLVCHDNGGWRLIKPHESTYRTVVDERDMDCDMGEGVVEYLGGDV